MGASLAARYRHAHHKYCDGQRHGSLPFWIVPLVAVSFGAIHLAARNFAFPNDVDVWLWRASAVASTAALPALYLIGLIILASDHDVAERLHNIPQCGLVAAWSRHTLLRV